MRNVQSSLIVTVALVALCASAVSAAPVNWVGRPGGSTAGKALAPANDAEALDELTAPLSVDQMGLSPGINFSTSFDAELRALRNKVQSESPTEEAPAAGDAPAPAQPPAPPTRIPSGQPFLPALDKIPDL